MATGCSSAPTACFAAKLVYRLAYPGVQIWDPSQAELAAIRDQGYQGQAAQDYFVIKTYFAGREAKGVYVDVGANEPIDNSNTCYFDRQLGWRGVAVEPLNRFAADWARDRTAKLLAYAATEQQQTLSFEEVIDSSGTPFSSVEGSSIKNKALQRRTITVQGERLDRLLDAQGIDAVEVMSIDVEGHEMQVLRGLDLNRIKVQVILIENNVPAFSGSAEIRRHLAQSGYRHTARVWHLDDVFVRQDGN